ncbi:MAG: SDR family NAD(P)-dependent oxidoreductase [Acidimicrobiales bacterium]
MNQLPNRDLVIGVTPFEEPNARLALAVQRGGGLGVLGLGRDGRAGRAALANAVRWSRGESFGVRVPDGCPLTPGDLPAAVDTVILGPGAPWSLGDPALSGRRVLVEVTSVAEARDLAGTAVAGLIAKGAESGGPVGETTAFVLLQQLLADPGLSLPVWSAGGIGLHTAAAAVAGGAAGVVLDAQLALVAESELSAEVSGAIAAMDGSETTVVGGQRVYTRPDLPVAGVEVGKIPRPNLSQPLYGARDLRRQLLPIGQDGALARPLAERFVTAGGVVGAVRRAIAEHIAFAQGSRPLAPGAPFAADRGMTVSVAQGPMTRVSDRAGFALAVAEGGGLPFLALALMSGDEVRALLEATKALLGDRPWGVGILGFVPAELRETQLAVIHDVRPPCALIAGGRPSQAAPLEAAGIDTFLHVPSPGLLDRFLRDGARKFIFEGRECGGHVGPRASFPLWESQIERLLAEDRLDDVHVLFAGGIHDERSAAMVAAAAAPLAVRGARIGVLMGTAYLFTEEAVATGAIVPAFQAAAVGCDTTVLLETSPGHATRCVDTEYVQTFRQTKARLEAGGASQQEIWAELEQLNLGRLRLASKGVRRRQHGDAMAAASPREPGNPTAAASDSAAGELVAPERVITRYTAVSSPGGAREASGEACDDRLLRVSDEEQRREGMVMIGDVATLRSATTTIAALHQQVSAGATEFLAARAANLGLSSPEGDEATESNDEANPLDIAIVGMACVFPQAADTERYWSNVVSGVDAVTEVPDGRWDTATFYDPAAVTTGAGRKTPSKWGGFLPEVPFDALAYGVPPASLSSVDPTQLLALEVAARALDDAGYRTRRFDRERTSVVFGAETGTDLAGAYGFRALHQSHVGPLPEALEQTLPALNEDSFPGVLSNVIAGRIANRLDLGGSNFTVDAACASSLAALDVACKELTAGTSDMVLCGGADVHNGLQDYLLFASVHALSPSGRCRTFDAKADGIALGEGVACVVLKRLADAERDGDRVYAVVKAVAGSSDGRSLGLTAPRPEGQRRALERAYRMAGVSPAQVGLVEAHGTGTVVGDRTELAALTTLFAESGAEPGSCALGSVKSLIGHTKCAAGLAGIIKVARSLYAGVRPPTGQLQSPNGYWDAETSPFFFDTAARPWAAPAEERVAGVSAFGFGGTNFHAVLAGYDGAPEPEAGVEEWPAELFVFRGADRAAAAEQMRQLTELVAANDRAGRPWRLRDLAFTTAVAGGAGVGAAGAGRAQVALVASDLDDLAAKLAAAQAFRAAPGVFVTAGDGGDAVDRAGNGAGSVGGEAAGGAGGADGADGACEAGGRIAFLFPGQGSQAPGMMADLFVAFPRLRRHLEQLRTGERDLTGVMFPPAAFGLDELAAQRAAITDTRVAQPTLGVAGLAMHELLGTVGVQPDLAGGHSYGELVALAAAGALDPDDLVSLSEARAAAILGAADGDPGTMAAVSATAEAVAVALDGVAGVGIANHNAPNQVVISGPTAAIARAMERLAEAGLSVKRMPVACAFHSPVVAAAAGRLRAALDSRAVAAPSLPVWSNTTAEPYPAQADAVRDTLARQVAEPVRFVDQIEAMYAAGARIFVEAGPGRVLTGLVGKILGPRPHVAVACDAPGEAGLARFLLALAELATSGVAVRTDALWRGRRVRRVSLASVPRRPGWLVNGHLVRTADGTPVAGGLQPMTAAPTSVPVAALAAGQPAERDVAVLEFLRTTRELVAAQRDVLLGYLGTGGENLAVLTSPSAITVDSAPAGSVAAALHAAAPGAAAIRVIAAPEVPEQGPLTREQILETVLTIVSNRTGYPGDMLDPDLDLEADLSIDSIKRTEILGELADQVGLAGDGAAIDESTVEALARLKTLNAIADWIVANLLTPEPGVAAESAAGGAPTVEVPVLCEVPVAEVRVAEVPALPVTGRHLVELEPDLAPVFESVDDASFFAGRRYVLVDGGLGIGLELSVLLEQRGADVVILDAGDDENRWGALDGADALVHLVAIDAEGPSVLPAAFAVLREAAERGIGRLLVASGGGGRFGFDRGADASSAGLGLAGLLRTVRAEYPSVVSQLVDVDPKDRAATVATVLLGELASSEPSVVLGSYHGERVTTRVVPVELTRPRLTPAADIAASTADLGLGAGSVVLLTGGARGITSKVAVQLARSTGCHIELIGRTQAPEGEEDPTTAAALDGPSLRRALVAAGTRDPKQVEIAVARTLAAREVRATLAALAGTAASAHYHVADVRDAAAVRAVVEDVYARHGRVDGVIHGAGVLEDKRMSDKGVESFNRVFCTKVDGARNLVAALRPDFGFLVLFASVAGVFGNRGQADYASANDALDGLARTWSGKYRGRVLAVDWGPWAGAGMVSPELEREYARRGVGLIGLEEGIACLLRELAWGPREVAQVVYMRGPLEP